MKNKNYWNLAIGISLLTHLGVIAASYPAITKNLPIKEKKEIKEIKITVKEVVKERTSKDGDGSRGVKSSKSLPPPPYISNVMRKLMGNDKERPSLDKPQILEKDSNKVIIFEKLENAKLKNNPSYMGYYKGIRSKLDLACHKNYSGKQYGNVHLSFVLLKDGTLEHIEGTGDNQELVQIAIKSVKESLPFLPFPAELKDQSYQFDVSILFKNN